MNENIHETLSSLVVDIDTLIPLPGNPRVGNIEAIMASYREFGQVKPIVVRPNDDGTSTVIAGNHQLEAARRLGWQEIAVVQMEADDKRALAFAMADNRTVELGYTEPEMLNDILSQITDVYPVLLEDLGWDDFELAVISESSTKHERSVLADGYIPPVINAIADIAEAIVESRRLDVEVSDEGEARIVAPSGSDQNTMATIGSNSIGASGSNRNVVQYTLVFETSEQQRKWYAFLRWLKNDPGIDGETTAERILNFIDSHADYS
jgi:ParB-like chromosome segregation protein Spo0J